MVLPGQPVPGQKIVRTRMSGVDDGTGGTPADRAGAAPDAVAFMAAYSDALDGEGRTRSRPSSDEQEVRRTDSDGEGATPAVGPAGDQTTPRPEAAPGPVRSGGGSTAARYLGDPAAFRSKTDTQERPATDLSDPGGDRIAQSERSDASDAAVMPASNAKRPLAQYTSAPAGGDMPRARAMGDRLLATEAKGDAALQQPATQARKGAANQSLHVKAGSVPSGPASDQDAIPASARPDAPRLSPRDVDPQAGPGARAPASAAAEPDVRTASTEAPERPEVPELAKIRAMGWPDPTVGPHGRAGAKGETGAPRLGPDAVTPPGYARVQAPAPSPAEPIGKLSQAPGSAATPGTPGQGTMHPGQHALDHAPGAAASSNGKGQGIGLASARTGGGEDTSAPGPGPRGTPIASTVAAADRPGAQPSVAEGGRTTPPPARDVPKDLAPRLGLDTPSRIDGSPAAAAGAAGPASPETGISTPPPSAGAAMAVAEMPGGSASETGSQALSSSASVGGPAAPATGQTGLATSSGNPQAMAQTAANQIVASLPRPLSELGTGTLEVALDPPELGRVRLSLVEVAGAMTLSITAERPETVELMRRHLDLLAQEFTRSGLDAPSVRVGTEGGGTHGHGPGADDAPDARTVPGSGLPEAETGLPLHPAPASDPRRALDLRL